MEDKTSTLKELRENERNMLSDNCMKYFVFTTVLDFLVMNKFLGGLEKISYNDIQNWLNRKSTLEFQNTYCYMIDLWFHEMIWMDLISFNDKTQMMQLTDNGYTAYKSHQYHFAYASLLEATNSRNLAKRALWVSVTAVVITVLSILVSSKG
jgi:hypothetical protein